jgi:nucleoside-diphosphate-sugar epimerase
VPRVIGVIGSNGRVGTEVTLLLACMHDITVAPISRSDYGAAFLKQCGMAPRIVPSDDALADALEDCDLVADFSMSSGATSGERRQRSLANIRRLVALSRPHAPIVFASSIMAFGMRHGDRTCRRYRISRTSYGTEKRRQEREVATSAAASGKPAFALRLGEVHGDLQPVTRYYVQAVRHGVVTLTRGLNSPSPVVTCFTIANALRNIADGREAPGLFTVVEQPEWTWNQFFQWVAANSGAEVVLNELPTPQQPSVAYTISPGFTRLRAYLFRIAADNRDVIQSYLPIPPRIEYRFRIEYQRRKAASEVSQRPIGTALRDQMLGPVPGARLRAPNGRDERRDAEQRVRELLDDRVSQQSHHFLAGVHWAPP